MTPHNKPSTHRQGPLSFTEIYRAIEAGDDFNRPQLFFLGRLVERKLERFNVRIGPRELEMKPYEY